VSLKPNKAEALKGNKAQSPIITNPSKAFPLFGSMLTNALKQLSTLKSGYPAP
jgi:hypothetical protein